MSRLAVWCIAIRECVGVLHHQVQSGLVLLGRVELELPPRQRRPVEGCASSSVRVSSLNTVSTSRTCDANPAPTHRTDRGSPVSRSRPSAPAKSHAPEANTGPPHPERPRRNPTDASTSDAPPSVSHPSARAASTGFRGPHTGQQSEQVGHASLECSPGKKNGEVVQVRRVAFEVFATPMGGHHCRRVGWRLRALPYSITRSRCCS